MISLRTKKVLSHRGISFVRTNARFNPALIFTLFIFFVTPIGHASLDADELINEDSFEDAFDESFEIETEQTEKTTFQNNSRLLRFTFAHEIGYHPDNTNKLPVNRSSLRLEWEHLITQQIFFRFDAKMAYDFAYDHHQYPVATTQNYRFQKKIREMYFQSTHQKISVKIGKQILVWGEADGAIVTDIISPRNLTEFIFQPIEDTRIGQIMLTIDYFSHNHHWTLLLNPDRKTNQFALPGHEYALFNPLQNNPLINLTKEQTPKTSLSDMEVGLRWKKTFSGHDVSFMLAEVTNNNPVLASQTIQNQQITLQPIFTRYQMLGFAMNWTDEQTLFKIELAKKWNKTFQSKELLVNQGLLRKNTIEWMLGIEYDANNDFYLSFELSDQWIQDWSAKLINRQHESNFYTIFSKNFLNETLKTQYVYIYQIQDQNAIHRLQTSYDINDQLKAHINLATFDIRSSTSVLKNFEDKNRISVKLEWTF